MIALYKRVSTTEQAQNGHSLAEQEERMRNYCKAFDWDNIKVYADGGFSGSNLDRPAMQRLISDIKAHKVEKVIVYKLDRLSRSQKDTLMLIEDTFLKNGCDFVSISENFDTSTPLGRAMIGIISVFAQLEREQIKERMVMGKEARAKQGKYSSSKALVGYDYIDGQLIPNDYEKSLVNRIFNDYANGKRIYSITRELNDSGLFHKNCKWNDNGVHRVLTNRTYLGEIKYSNIWYQGNHEPIISEDLFKKCQKNLERVREESIEMHRRFGANSVLGGVLYCAKCGAKFSKKSQICKNYDNYVYYVCNSRLKPHKSLIKDPNCKNKRWKMSELDEIILGEIKKLSFEKSKVEKVKTDNSIAEKKIKEIDKQIEKYMELYTLGKFPIDVINQKVDELNEQRKKLCEVPKEKMTYEEAEQIALSLDDILANGNSDEINALVRALIDRIEIDDEDITIHWAFE